MTMIDHARADAQANRELLCPQWCTGESDMHPDEEGTTSHRRLVGELGTLIEWTPTDPSDPAPSIYVPELDVDDLHASPSFARKLAVELIAAADVIDGVTP